MCSALNQVHKNLAGNRFRFAMQRYAKEYFLLSCSQRKNQADDLTGAEKKELQTLAIELVEELKAQSRPGRL
jgi:diadenosine tetraphosphate (Ap4A) HIT family hydrolase